MRLIESAELSEQRVAVLYQALPPPMVDGLRKDAKPGGYADSGADIAACLQREGVAVLTPVASPDPARMMDWVFPDTEDGMAQAAGQGGTLLWANTVLFEGHPLEARLRDFWIVGQLPSAQQAFDDKFATNGRLAAAGLPVATSVLVALDEARADGPAVRRLSDLTVDELKRLSLRFPLVVKPVRGRGSQGVEKVDDLHAMQRSVQALINSGRFGGVVVLEQYFEGTELTVTVMPGRGGPTCLPPVRRFNHEGGIAPYNGVKAVTTNSVAMSPAEMEMPSVRTLQDACLRAAELVDARAPIRIDCRAGADGQYRLFDLNMKPNMTGAGRPGREDQDSLSAIAARALGWDFAELLRLMLTTAWRN